MEIYQVRNEQLWRPIVVQLKFLHRKENLR